MMRTLTAASLLTLASISALARADEPAKKDAVPRVLLLTSGPTREFQFCRRLFIQEMEQKRIELGICLQVADPKGERVQDVPSKRFFHEFPADFSRDYDRLIAFDPDWSELKPEQLTVLEKWVEQGGGLVLIPGPIHTFQLIQPANRDSLKPIRNLFPVALDDIRLAAYQDRQTRLPWKLHFTAAAKEQSFLRLDVDSREPLAGWDDFFNDGKHPRAELDPQQVQGLIDELDSDRFEVREKAFQKLTQGGRPAVPLLQAVLRKKPSLEVRTRVERLLERLEKGDVARGFYDYYPVKAVKPAATLLATFSDPAAKLANGSEQPYLVTMPYGKGQVVYLGSGEMWRLRQFRETFHDRFWRDVVSFAAARR